MIRAHFPQRSKVGVLPPFAIQVVYYLSVLRCGGECFRNGFQPNVTGGNSLSMNISDGDVSSALGLFKQVAQTFVMTKNATNYVYLDLSVSPPVLKVNTTGFPTVNVYQIATAVTDSAKITAWHDSRPPFNNLLYGGGSGSQVCFEINGTALPCEPNANIVSPLTAVDNPGATRTDIGISVCAGGSSHTSGVVPDPGVTPDTTKFWRSDCTLGCSSGFWCDGHTKSLVSCKSNQWHRSMADATGFGAYRGKSLHRYSELWSTGHLYRL